MRLLTSLYGAVLIVAATALANSGYLAIVGPPPLRFESPANPGVARVPLPPLITAETNETASMAEPSSTPPLNTVEPPTATNFPPFEIDVFGTGESSTNLAQNVAREPDVISPQVWLKYFIRNTNAGTSTAVIAPVGFLPPQPAIPPSSKGNYQTGP